MKWLWFVIGLFILLCLPVNAMYSSYYPNIDTYVSYFTPNVSYGNSTIFEVTALPVGHKRMLFNFTNVDFHNLEGENKVILKLYHAGFNATSSGYPTDYFNIECYYVVGDFDNSVTWDTMPSYSTKIGNATFVMTSMTYGSEFKIPMTLYPENQTKNYEIMCWLRNVVDTYALNGTIASKEHPNTNFKPVLIINQTTAPPPPTNLSAKIINVTATKTIPKIDEIVNISVRFTNNGSISGTFYLGLSVGKNGTEYVCNRDCYADGLGDYVSAYIHPMQTITLSRLFKFDDAVFDGDNYYDLMIGIYSEPYLHPMYALDKKELIDYFYVLPVPNIPEGVSAKIVKVVVTPTELPFGYITNVTTWIQNNGSVMWNFTLGLSIGDNDTYMFCNRDCYADCLESERRTPSCDYRYTGYIHSGQVISISRLFKFREDFFTQAGKYDMLLGVYHAPYVAGIYALDKNISLGLFTLDNTAPVIIYDIKVEPSEPRYNEDVTFKWKTNLPTDSYLSVYDRNGRYKGSTREYAEVYEHEINRSGAYYFNEPANYNISIQSCLNTYPKNCSDYNFTLRVVDEFGSINVISPLREGIRDWLGIPYVFTLAFISLIISIIVGAYVSLKTSWHLGLVVIVVFLLMFALIGWLPIWVLILITLVAGFIVAKFGRDLLGG